MSEGTDIVQLGFGADTSALKGAKRDLDDLNTAGAKTDKVIDRIKRTTKDTGVEVQKTNTALQASGKYVRVWGQESKDAAAAFNKLKIEAINGQKVIRGVGDGMDHTAKATKRANSAFNAMSLRNPMQQLSQVAQQGAVTGDYLTALAIQLPDMTAMMGPFAIAAGVAAGAMLPLAYNMLTGSENAEAAEDALESYTDALDRFSNYASTAIKSTGDLREEFGMFAEEIRAHAIYMSKVAASDALRTFNTQDIIPEMQAAINSADEIARAREDLERTIAQRDQGFATVEQVQMSREALAGVEAKAQDVADKLGLSVKQVLELGPLVNKLNQSDTLKGTAEISSEIVSRVEEMTGGSVQLTDQMVTFLQRMYDVETSTAGAAEAMKDVESSANGTVQADLDDAMKNAAQYGSDFADYMADALSSVTGMTKANIRGLFGDAGDAIGSWMQRAEGLQSATELIQESEGFEEEAYPDMSYKNGQRYNSGWRAGYGSDTYTTKDGKAHRVQKGMRVSLEDATRDLERRIGTYFNKIIDEIGMEAFNDLSAPQQGSLASLLHNYGAGEFSAGGDLAGVREALMAGNDTVTAQRIAALGSHNNGINMDRRREEAKAFGDASLVTGQQDEAQKALNKALREAEKARSDAERAAEKHNNELERSEEAYRSLMGSMDPVQQAHYDYEDAIEAVNDALQKELITETEAAKARQLAKKTLNESLQDIADDDAEDTLKKIEDRAKDTSGVLTDVIFNAQSAGDAFEMLGNAVTNAAQSIVQSNLQKILEDLFNTQQGGSGGGGNWFSNMLSSVFGGMSGSGGESNPTPKPRAGGGNMYAGQPYAVAERGTELFIPSENGHMIPNNTIGQGGSGEMEVIVRKEGVDVREERGPNGNMRLVVEGMVNDVLKSGRADKTMGTRYGVRPKPQGGR